MSSIEERNLDIVQQLTDGTASIVSLGNKYNISRERVSQIYYKATGEDRGKLLSRRKDIRTQDRAEFLMSIKFKCAGCGKEVSRAEGRYKRKYCADCHFLSQYHKRALDVTYKCSTCGKDYHPFANSKHKRVMGQFCSLDCYYKFPNRRKNAGSK